MFDAFLGDNFPFSNQKKDPNKHFSHWGPDIKKRFLT